MGNCCANDTKELDTAPVSHVHGSKFRIAQSENDSTKFGSKLGHHFILNDLQKSALDKYKLYQVNHVGEHGDI